MSDRESKRANVKQNAGNAFRDRSYDALSEAKRSSNSKPFKGTVKYENVRIVKWYTNIHTHSADYYYLCHCSSTIHFKERE